MCKILELSGLFVCLGELLKLFGARVDRKIAGLRFAGGISPQVDTIHTTCRFILGERFSEIKKFPFKKNL